MNSTFTQVAIAVTVSATLLLLSDPFMYWMPRKAAFVCLVLASVLIVLSGGLVLREHAYDEREAYHRMYAGRVAYLLGITVLTAGLLIQGFTSRIDPWISLTLSVMIVSKLFARMYLDRQK
jgi:L-asparagine transporter-like permease